MDMFTRMGFALLALIILSPPASAQLFREWQEFGYEPFWEQPRPRRQREYRPRRERHRYWNGEEGRGDRKARDVASGGARPDIEPEEVPIVAFPNDYMPGTIVIDVAGRKLYYVTSPYEAYRYPVAVGREGFSWAGTESISRMAAWPDWHPPEEMRDRDFSLPKKMTGGIRNPLGAMALYLGDTLYRIHGTNDAKSLGRAASSGCFRMHNKHVLHLARMARVGSTVIVEKKLPSQSDGIADARS